MVDTTIDNMTAHSRHTPGLASTMANPVFSVSFDSSRSSTTDAYTPTVATKTLNQIDANRQPWLKTNLQQSQHEQCVTHGHEVFPEASSSRSEQDPGVHLDNDRLAATLPAITLPSATSATSIATVTSASSTYSVAYSQGDRMSVASSDHFHFDNLVKHSDGPSMQPLGQSSSARSSRVPAADLPDIDKELPPAPTRSNSILADIDGLASGSAAHSAADVVDLMVNSADTTVATASLAHINMLEQVRAVYDFTPLHDHCLAFKEGQIIHVQRKDASGWWDGYLAGQTSRGWFPSNYVTSLDQDAKVARASITVPRHVATKSRDYASSTTSTAAASANDLLTSDDTRALTDESGTARQADDMEDASANEHANKERRTSDDRRSSSRAKCRPGARLSSLGVGSSTSSPQRSRQDSISSSAASPTSTSFSEGSPSPTTFRFPGAATSVPGSEPMARAASSPVTSILRQISATPAKSPLSQSTTTSSSARRRRTSCLQSVTSATKALQRAVDAGLRDHYVPSAQDLVQSARAVLEAIDCLSKESYILQQHGSLAQRRKQILPHLGALVTQSRDAGDPTTSDRLRNTAVTLMMQTARTVNHRCEDMLLVAEELGLLSPSSPQATAVAVGPKSTGHSSQLSVGPSSSAAHSRVLRKAQSLSNVRTRKLSSASNAASATGGASPDPQAMVFDFLSHAPTPMYTSRTHLSQAVLDGRHFQLSAGRVVQQRQSQTSETSPRTPSPAASSIGSTQPFVMPDYQSNNGTAVCRHLDSLHDQLMSLVAEFIGNVSAISATSDANVHTALLELTSIIMGLLHEFIATVDCVTSHATVTSALVQPHGLVEAYNTLHSGSVSLLTAAKALINRKPQVDALDDDDDLVVQRRCATDQAMMVYNQISSCKIAAEAVLLHPRFATLLFNRPAQFEPSGESRSSSRMTFVDCSDDLSTVEAGPDAEIQSDNSIDSKADRNSQHSSDSASDYGHRISTFMLRDDAQRPPEASAPGLHQRRGLRPALLPLDTRPSSHGGMSQTSTITSLHDFARSPKKAATSAPHYAGSEAMSREESSRGSAASSAASSAITRTSDPSTAGTSPRNSIVIPSPELEKAPWQLAAMAHRPHLAQRGRSGSCVETSALSRPILPLSAASSAILPTSSLAISPRLLDRSYQPQECCFNADGNLTGGTFACLVERMTLHDQLPDAQFANTFFLTFRLFTTPIDLMQALFTRFLLIAPSGLQPAESLAWHERKLRPIRLRVVNTFKIWLDSYWRANADALVLEPLAVFVQKSMAPVLASPANSLMELIKRKRNAKPQPKPWQRPLWRTGSTEMVRGVSEGSTQSYMASPLPMSWYSIAPPAVVVSKSLLSQLRNTGFVTAITDFDPLELARQLTVMEMRLFCEIEADELLSNDTACASGQSSRLKAMSTATNRLTNWITSIILDEKDAKKRCTILKFFIKLNERLLSLQNYNTLMAVVAALNSSPISRLKRTWQCLQAKYANLWAAQQKLVENARNYGQYRAVIKTAVAPCLPFVGIYLQDREFARAGNPTFRASPLDPSLQLINFDRYRLLSRLVLELQRFQQPYNLADVPEIQNFIHLCLSNSRIDEDQRELYRKSLLVEPRDVPLVDDGMPPPSATSEFFKRRL